MLLDDYQLERQMFNLWLRETGETNDVQINHLKNCIHLAIERHLTDKQRQYLTLYMNGYNQIEIAELVGINKSTVSRTLNRALNALFDHIQYATPATLLATKRARKCLTRLYK